MYTLVIKEGVKNMIGLEEILKVYNMPVTELAEQLNVTRGYVYNWISGKRNIPQKTLIKLSVIFNNLPKEYFTKELTEIEKIEVRTSQIEGLVSNPATYYAELIESNKQQFEEDYEDRFVQLSKVKFIANIANRVKEILESAELEYVEEIFDSVLDIIDSKKFSQKVLNDILGSVIISYGGVENKKNNEFINKLVRIINENEEERQKKKKDVEQMLKSIDIEDLFN